MRKKHLLLIVLAILLIGCGSPDGQPLVDAAREVQSVSVLTLNTFAFYDQPQNDQGIRWRDRYSRIATWMRDSGTLPDVIALQEAEGYLTTCPPDQAGDYESLGLLIHSIKASTGANYRIAYLIGGEQGYVHAGNPINHTKGIPIWTCARWGGMALLYNADRIENVTGYSHTASMSYNDTNIQGIHLRRSLPCCYPAPGDEEVCSLIDGPTQKERCDRETPAGVAWVVATKNPRLDHEWWREAVMVVLKLVSAPDMYIHLYNVHLPLCKENDVGCVQQGIASMATRQLIQDMEGKFWEQKRLLPPIVVGDFNLGADENGVLAPDRFMDFEVVNMFHGTPPWTKMVSVSLTPEQRGQM